MDEGKSFELRYVGGRFDGGRLPVDVLSDLAAFRDLLIAFAKEDWKGRNQGRERVPKGFDKSLAFSLTSIREGSAIPKLQWDREAAQQSLPGFSDELDEILSVSYTNILNLIDGADRAANDISLSSSHVRALNKFGAKLRPGERIEFLQNSSSNVIYLDTSKRRTLITRVRETYQSRFDSVGTLIGLNFDDGTITVKTIEHGNITIPVEQDRILEEFNGSILADVQFDVNLELDHLDKIRNILDVYSAEIVDSNSNNSHELFTELSEIGQLAPGWLDGEGEAISRAAIIHSRRLISSTEHLNIDFRLYPTELGGVLFEFDMDSWAYSLEINKSGSLHLVGASLTSSENFASEIFEAVTDDFLAILGSRTIPHE